MKLNIISPTRGENYTVTEAVWKLLERRNFKIHRLVKYDGPYSQGYSDYDGFLFLDAETLPSHWGPSIETRVQAHIPFHVTNAEAFQFPGSAYLYGGDIFPVRISAWLRKLGDFHGSPMWKPSDEPSDDEIEARDEVQFYWTFGNEDPEQREVQDLIVKVAKRALIAFAMENLPVRGFYADYGTHDEIPEIPDLFE